MFILKNSLQKITPGKIIDNLTPSNQVFQYLRFQQKKSVIMFKSVADESMKSLTYCFAQCMSDVGTLVI